MGNSPSPHLVERVLKPRILTLIRPVFIDEAGQVFASNRNPSLGGFSIWDWPPNSGGPEDKGYTPEGKPALDVLRDWLKKGRWEVK